MGRAVTHAPDDIVEKLAALEDRTNQATPYVRISGEVLRAAIKEIHDLRAVIKGREAHTTKTLFDDGPNAA